MVSWEAESDSALEKESLNKHKLRWKGQKVKKFNVGNVGMVTVGVCL